MLRIKILLIILPILTVVENPLFAQDEPQYLFSLKDVKYSGFGNTISEFSFVDGDYAFSTGGAGALLINYTYFLGFYGTNLVTDHFVEDIYPTSHDPIANPRPPIYTDMQLSFEDNGMWFGYINNHKKLIHWSANMKMGWGKISIYDKHIDFEDSNKTLVDNVFSVSPELNIELNLTRWFKMNVGVGYKFVTSFDNYMYTNYLGNTQELYKPSQFNTPFANIKFMFGAFERRNRHMQIDQE